jgi:hypothetical protein
MRIFYVDLPSDPVVDEVASAPLELKHDMVQAEEPAT